MNQLGLLRQTHADYCKLRKTKDGLSDLPDLELVAVARTFESAAMDRRLFDRVAKALAGNRTDGWARFRSELGWSGCPPPCFERSGPPIMAEWLDGTGKAHRLTPEPNAVGRALVVTVSERPLNEGDSLKGDEFPVLRQCLEVMAHSRVKPFTHIAYKVYWGLLQNGSPSATRRLFDRFAGFRSRKEG